MTSSRLSASEVLDLIPQKHPFRFIDRILEINEEKIKGEYTFKDDECFYPGHFPGSPLTPGAILLEAMAQTGIVAFGIYLASETMTPGEIQTLRTIFTEAEVEFTGMVKPGDHITICATKRYFRRLKIKVDAEIFLDSGRSVCRGTIAGMGKTKE